MEHEYLTVQEIKDTIREYWNKRNRLLDDFDDGSDIRTYIRELLKLLRKLRSS